jgi:hypothetical protein
MLLYKPDKEKEYDLVQSVRINVYKMSQEERKKIVIG